MLRCSKSYHSEFSKQRYREQPHTERVGPT